MRQADFFKAEVIPFPFDRQRTEVLRAAKFLNLAAGEWAERGWKRRIKHMTAPLRAAGVPESEIQKQVLAYRAAVERARVQLTEQVEVQA